MIIAGALITGGFTLTAALIPIIVKGWHDWPKKLRRRLIIGAVIVAAVASASMGIYLSYVIPQSPHAAITIPTGTAVAPAEVAPGSIIEGHASDVPHDALFLILRSTEGEGLRYYPQSQVNDWTGTSWRAALYALAGAGHYDLLAVAVTSAEASGELQMYIQICQTTACQGVEGIPPDMETLASVPVIIP